MPTIPLTKSVYFAAWEEVKQTSCEDDKEKTQDAYQPPRPLWNHILEVRQFVFVRLRLDQQIGAQANENAKEDARKQRNAKNHALVNPRLKLCDWFGESQRVLLKSWLVGKPDKFVPVPHSFEKRIKLGKWTPLQKVW
jgi:hypothetical protein